jgi:hypothetical protein
MLLLVWVLLTQPQVEDDSFVYLRAAAAAGCRFFHWRQLVFSGTWTMHVVKMRRGDSGTPTRESSNGKNKEFNDINYV